MRRFLIGIAAVLIMAGAAQAKSRSPLDGEVGIEVLSDRGSAFLSIPYQEQWKHGTKVSKRFLEAHKGEQYGIIVRNRTASRIGLVIAVDGRNIITGRRSDLSGREAMYIVESRGQGRFDGWRTAHDQVHRFYFTSAPDSYAVRTFSDSSAMGVIAIAVFREKVRPLERPARRSAPSAPRAEERSQGKSSLSDESAGTGFGNSAYSPVIAVEFEPERRPAEKILVKYEWREVLCRKGLLNCGRGTGNRLWDDDAYAPFPPQEL